MSDCGVYEMELGRLASFSGGLHLDQGCSMNINGQREKSTKEVALSVGLISDGGAA